MPCYTVPSRPSKEESETSGDAFLSEYKSQRPLRAAQSIKYARCFPESRSRSVRV